MHGISKQTIENHIKLYTGYINKYNELTDKLHAVSEQDLAQSNQVYSTVRALKTEMSFAWGGVINHEIYFNHLGGNGGTASGNVLQQIKKDFGSFESYKKDMKASALAARGWAWTVWSSQEERFINHIGDTQNTYALWGATPVVALDTYEHAYFLDNGVNRTAYIDAFFENINWNVVEEMFNKIKK